MPAIEEPSETEVDPQRRQTIIEQLDDTAVHTIAALRSGKRCRFSGRPDHFDALVVEVLPTEFRGYGDPALVADLMLSLTGWNCVEVEQQDASVVADRLASQGGLPSRFYDSLYYELRSPAPRIAISGVRLLDAGDLDLVQGADPQLELKPETFRSGAIVAGAIVNGRLVAQASCWARSERYGDISVVTLEPFRGHGLATSAAAEVAGRLQQEHLEPVWSTGATNWASQRIAEKLGFVPVAQLTYVVAVRDHA